jgi:hypothetical protein
VLSIVFFVHGNTPLGYLLITVYHIFLILQHKFYKNFINFFFANILIAKTIYFFTIL